MNKVLGLLFLLLIVCKFCEAQSIKVVDKTTLQPLTGVVVTASGKSVITDDKGLAEFNGSLSSTSQFHFTYVGYQTRTISLQQLQELKYQVALTQQSYNLNEVVVSAGRFTQQQQLVPQQVEVLTRRELEFMSQPTTADVVQQSGKVLVQKSQMGGGSPIIRGFEANKVLLVVDGVRMNNAIYRGGHLQNIITLDNSMLDRAEVVFGPSSVVYGSDALGGVLHFHTLQPALSVDKNKLFTGSAFTRYATAPDEKTIHAQLNYGRKKWGSLTSITVSDFGNLRQGKNRKSKYGDLGIRNFYAARVAGRDTMLVNPNPNIQQPTGYTQFDVLQKVLYKPSESISHTLNLQLSTSTDVPRYDRLTEFSGSKLKFAEWYYGPQKRLLAAYTLGLAGATAFYDEAKLVTAYQNLEESRHNRRFGRNDLSHQTEQVQVYSINTDLSKSITRHRLQYGLEATYNKVNSKANIESILTGATQPQSTRYPDGGSSMHSAAAYLTHTLDLKPWLILNQGLRYSYVGLDAVFDDKTFFPFLADELKQRNHALSGNAGIVALPGKGWRFSILGSSGFRAPNVDDLSKVFDSTPGNVIVPNPQLKPEYTYNLEASASKSIKERLHLELVSYYTWYRDAITTQPVLFNGQDSILYDGQLSQVTANVNAGKAYLYGYSASLKADVTNTLSLSSSLNYTYGRIEQSEGDIPLDHVPPLFGRTSINLQVKRFRAEAFILYNGAKKLKDYNPSGEDNLRYATPQGMTSWYTLNLRTAYQLTPDLQLQAAIENITDRYYRVFASGISAPGRNLVLTVRGRF
ncbi:hemoglobin/transferrin/lactoferrin receptor protein [Pontibacter aydingkolensis]|uniref:TonB-dependent receptor n=1 Tax=Pontibacter aydingkolensis TaxID=1911536 RepID=A0ABS7CXE9_9BACT|nr:TonB-dependent receptor [Pontibacter aydingkolensis]MBW7468192.1 TonB-dependent receptor [Pontibacter aydingkolensis]